MHFLSFDFFTDYVTARDGRTHDTSIFCLIALSVDCATWVGFSVSHLQVNGEIEIWFHSHSLRLHEQSLGLRQVDEGSCLHDVWCLMMSYVHSISVFWELLVISDRFRSDNGGWCCPWGKGGRRTRVPPGYGEPHKETTKRQRFCINKD